MMSDREQIKAVVAAITQAWLSKQYELIDDYLAADVVIAAPDSDTRVIGREAYVQSFRDYDSAAVTDEFDAGNPLIDVIGDAAVALCPFRISYQLNGVTYRETGTEMLVLNRSSTGWLVIWRSMRSNPAA
ncbi:MAG TPA: DUF4440 domain-containing protein [Thermoanaerobaculia bacterium]|jgi:ketosteroid isomerase-like protein|nr:DUF4440 domain-containing protein [Thermoanaerobaculia bacterium]